jgi:TolB-like protein/CRP-like cAMP-binding protein
LLTEEYKKEDYAKPANYDERRKIFERHLLFGKLSASEINELISYSRVERYRAGREIFAKGSPGQSLMAVLRGSVKISSLSDSGKEIVFTIFNAGEIFGEIAALDGEERSADATALTDCELLVLNRRDEQVEDVIFRNLESRIAKALVQLAESIGLRGIHSPSVELHLSQRELGNMAGGSRESEAEIKSSKLWPIVPKLDCGKRRFRGGFRPDAWRDRAAGGCVMGALAPGSAFVFESFQLDRCGLFRRDERGVLTPVALGGRALDLLGVLVERHGEVVSKAEIMAAVWPNMAVEDGNLTLQMSALRRVLDQGRTEGSFIQTVARRGYRFAAAVTRSDEGRAARVGAVLSKAAAGAAPRLSIVVLPFVNLSDDPRQEYFADGITDDLTTDLSRIAGSLVIARSTAYSYKGKSVDVRQIGRELGVHYVLEGSVRLSRSRVRVNVQLIDAERGGHVWAERFETDRQKLLEAEDEIVGRLARTLNLELVEAVGRRIEREKAVDPDARDLVMRGWARFHRPRSEANIKEAQRAFEQALTLDPQSFEARIGLATVLAAAILEGWSRCLPEDQARVQELLTEVFGRGANHSTSHYAMAMLRRSQQRLTEARLEAERAVALDHNNSAALYELGLAHMYLGEPEAAIPHIAKAIRLSPRDPFLSAMHYGLARCQLFLGHLQEAIELFERVRAERPGYWDAQMWLAGALALAGDLDGARAELAEARRLKPEIDCLARWREHQPWIAIPQYRALREQTLYSGLRRAGFPDE